MKHFLSTCTCMMIVVFSYAQNGVAISNPPSTPDASAILDLKSTTQGLLIPRMTAANKAAIAFPATGLMIYQIDNNPGYYFYNGLNWQRISLTGEEVGDNLGNHIMSTNLSTNDHYLSKYGTALGIQVKDSGAISIRGDNRGSGYASGGPAERFFMGPAGEFVSRGILGIGVIPATGSGERMMWHPYKAAFRAGSIGSGGTQWDDTNVGFYTAGFGYNTIATGLASFVSGYASSSTGSYSTVLGYASQATGTGSFAAGYRCNANASYAVAIGQRASANGKTGAMVFSDASTTDSTLASANNQFNARFSGGYRLYTNSTKTVGVQLSAGGNSWAIISDSSRKENFIAAESDEFLESLASLRLGSWNYKGQDPAAFRHYGPMAQEIFATFGKDNYGVIGNDTTIASADLDGIIMILLQGLEARTSKQQETIARLEEENAQLQSALMKFEALQAQLEETIKVAQKGVPK